MSEVEPLLPRHQSDPKEKKRCFLYEICDPKSNLHAYFALTFMCLLGFGSYFCYDNPGALQNQMLSQMGISTQDFASLYSWYSWPNVVICLIGGYLIDRVFGIRWGAIFFSLFILFGQVVFATGAYVNSLPVMYLGRFIFGIGGESLQVSQNAYACKWFTDNQLNFIFGLQLSIGRVGSTINFISMGAILAWVSNWFTGYQAIGMALYVAVAFCLFSQFCAFMMAYLDKRRDRVLALDGAVASKTVEQPSIKLKDVLGFPGSFWSICVVCVAFYVAIFPFVALGTVFFVRKFGLSPTEANTLDGMIYLISTIGSPVVGLLVDYFGYNLAWLTSAIVVTIGAHMLLAFSTLNPWVAVVILGLAYTTVACSLWPLVPLIIPSHQHGTAYGFVQALQNLGLGLVTLVAGKLVDSKGYLFLEIFFIDCLFVSLIGVILLFIFNTRSNGPLNLSAKTKAKQQAEKTRQEEIQQQLQASGFHIRNRFLSRIGAPLPQSYDAVTRAIVLRGTLYK